MKTKFTREQNSVLSEIYRRLNYFHNGNLNESLLLLSMPFNAKVLKPFGLIEPYRNKETPRVLNWYNLTTKGRNFFRHYITVGKLSDKTNSDIFSGQYIKVFDYALLEQSRAAQLTPHE